MSNSPQTLLARGFLHSIDYGRSERFGTELVFLQTFAHFEVHLFDFDFVIDYPS